MASTSNPPGCDINHYYANANIQLDGGGGGSLNDNVNPLAIYDFAGPSSAENLTETPNYLSLIHNPGISVEWAPEEQQVLEELLVRYAADTTFQRYSKIAHALHDKTIRDVAFRCRWMNEMQNRWKDHQSSSKNNEEKIAIATNVLSESYGAHSIIPSNTTLMPPINHDDRIDCTSQAILFSFIYLSRKKTYFTISFMMVLNYVFNPSMIQKYVYLSNSIFWCFSLCLSVPRWC